MIILLYRDNYYNDLVTRIAIHKQVNDSFTIITKDEIDSRFNRSDNMIVNVNIDRRPGYAYHFVTGFGFAEDLNMLVYFDGKINANVQIYIYGMKVV